jgi:hypothetical protein
MSKEISNGEYFYFNFTTSLEKLTFPDATTALVVAQGRIWEKSSPIANIFTDSSPNPYPDGKTPNSKT